MTISMQPPKPGDLITSAFMRQLIEHLVALDDRLTKVEQMTPGADGRVAITQITPSSVAVGDTIQIIGVNFGLPGENIVTFDGATSLVPTAGDDRRLQVVVPTISLGAGTSKTVLVGVTNRTRGFDSFPIEVHQVEPTIPGGTILVTPGPIPAIVPGGAAAVIPFTIDARTNMDETFDLVPSGPLTGAGAPLFTLTMVTDQLGNTELPKPYRIFLRKPPAGQVSTIASAFLRVVVPSGTAVTSPFVRLDVTSVRNPPPNPNPLAGTTGQVTFSFGQPQQAQTITFGITTLVGVTGDLVSVTVPLRSNPTPPIEGINYAFRGFKAGNYTATLSWTDTASNNRGWTASFGGAPGQANWPRLSLPIAVATPGDFPTKVAIVGAPGAQANTLRITITSNTNPSADFGIHNQGVVPGTVIG